MNRIDGRRADQLRPVHITPDYTKFAEGCVLMEMGDTRVLCTATVEEKVPLHIKSGGWITAEYSMLPRANRDRTARDISRLKLSPRSAEIQRLIGRSLRSAADLELLGPRQIIVDCDVLQGDGGTRTASITGGFLALVMACRRLVAEGRLERLPLRTFLAGISAGIVEGEVLLDLCYEEDSRAEVDFNCIMTAEGSLVELQATGEGRPFTVKEHEKLLSMAASGIRELHAIQKTITGALI